MADLLLSDAELERLARRVAELLAARDISTAPAVVYSPATLAAELGRSERSIRAAIARGELQAVKRGRGYVISADAVAAWSTAPATQFQELVPKSASRGRRGRDISRPGPARRALQS